MRRILVSRARTGVIDGPAGGRTFRSSTASRRRSCSTSRSSSNGRRTLSAARSRSAWPAATCLVTRSLTPCAARASTAARWPSASSSSRSLAVTSSSCPRGAATAAYLRAARSSPALTVGEIAGLHHPGWHRQLHARGHERQVRNRFRGGRAGRAAHQLAPAAAGKGAGRRHETIPRPSDSAQAAADDVHVDRGRAGACQRGLPGVGRGAVSKSRSPKTSTRRGGSSPRTAPRR